MANIGLFAKARGTMAKAAFADCELKGFLGVKMYGKGEAKVVTSSARAASPSPEGIQNPALRIACVAFIWGGNDWNSRRIFRKDWRVSLPT